MRSGRHLLVLLIALGGMTATVSAHPVVTPNETVSAAGMITGLLRTLSLALTAGWAAYHLLDRETVLHRRGYAVGLILVLISLWSDMAWYAAWLNESGIEYLYFSPYLPTIALQSEHAPLWALRIIAVLMLAAPLFNTASGTRWLALIGGALVSLASVTLSVLPDAQTTAIITQQAEIPRSALLARSAGQGLHLYLAALWAGGLIFALWGVRSHPTARRTFFRYTQWLLAVMAVTGLLLTWLHAGSLTALLQTGYGGLTLLKAGVILGLMMVGMRWSSRSTNESRLSLTIQIVLIAIALVASAMLGTLDSARRVAEWRTDEYFHSFDNSFYDAQIVRPLEINLMIIPGLTGQNRLIVTLIDSEVGTRLDDAQSVTLSLTNAQSPEPLILTLEAAGDGNYVTVAALESAGEWQARADVSRAEITRSADFIFSLNVPPPDLPDLLSVETTEPVTPFDRVISAVSGLLLLGLGITESVRYRRASVRDRTPSPLLTSVLAGLCNLTGVCLFITGVL